MYSCAFQGKLWKMQFMCPCGWGAYCDDAAGHVGQTSMTSWNALCSLKLKQAKHASLAAIMPDHNECKMVRDIVRNVGVPVRPAWSQHPKHLLVPKASALPFGCTRSAMLLTGSRIDVQCFCAGWVRSSHLVCGDGRCLGATSRSVWSNRLHFVCRRSRSCRVCLATQAERITLALDLTYYHRCCDSSSCSNKY